MHVQMIILVVSVKTWFGLVLNTGKQEYNIHVAVWVQTCLHTVYLCVYVFCL